MDKVAFIIAHKYFRGYKSYLRYYIDNILTCYPEALIIVVDNNSDNLEDIQPQFNSSDKLILTTNQFDSKFELGAYRYGLDIMTNLQLLNEYRYIVCTQDTYILKNKYNFDELEASDTKACSIIGWPNDFEKMDVMEPVLRKLNLFDNELINTNLCWCNSFIIRNDCVHHLLNYLNQIVITTRHQSEASERYLGRILYEINDNKNYAIDGANNTFKSDGVEYDCHHVNPLDDVDKYFCKVSQQKNERTINF